MDEPENVPSTGQISVKRPIGRPWVPGQSGNPGGRPKGAAIRTLILRETDGGEALVRKLLELIDGRLPRTRPADVIKAIELLLAYSYGKPVQITEISGPDGGPLSSVRVDLARLSIEQLEQVRGILGTAQQQPEEIIEAY